VLFHVQEVVDKVIMKLARRKGRVPAQDVNERLSITNPLKGMSSRVIKSGVTRIGYGCEAKTALTKSATDNLPGSRVLRRVS
jgi:hypothetical protein